MKIKGILIDVEKLTVTEVEFENNLSSYYRLLKCDCITMMKCLTAPVGGLSACPVMEVMIL